MTKHHHHWLNLKKEPLEVSNGTKNEKNCPLDIQRLKWYWLIPTVIVIICYSALKIAEGHMLAHLINSIVQQIKVN